MFDTYRRSSISCSPRGKGLLHERNRRPIKTVSELLTECHVQ
jgi:hypothetical protein